MIPLNHILRKCTRDYKFHKSQERKINHQIYMDDIKLFARYDKELENLMQAMRISSDEIGMEFRIEKYAKLIMKSGRR